MKNQMKNEKIVNDFEKAVRTLIHDEACEYADPNRESADFAREKYNKIKKKLLKN